jgi:hypothetical protein
MFSEVKDKDQANKLYKKFDTSYVSNIADFLEENSYLTSGQYNSLVKVYTAFRMDNLQKN